MPNRVATLRSSVPGNMPQAATRAPGELWLNFADAHIGYIDASQNAQKLLAVRLFVSTAPYAIGDFVVYAGNLYQAIAPSSAGAFTAANWTKTGTAQDLLQYLPLAGGTLTGALTLPAAVPTGTQATSKTYVDAGDATVMSAVTAGDAAANANANSKLPLAGGTLTGALNGTTAAFSGVATAADPPLVDSSGKLVTTAWFGSHLPATKENSNRIINGDMRIDQRNAGASGTATNGYTVDRWAYAANQATKGTWGRNINAVAGPPGFPYYLGFQSSSAYPLVAADYFVWRQPIEADAISDFAFGSANAQPVTLSFWAYSSLTGVFGASIANFATNRSYPFAYSIPTANTWTKIAVTIPGDTAGTWVMSGNGGGMFVYFGLGVGATASGPANAWASTLYLSATGAVSVVATNGAVFYLTGVKLEVGSVATPFNRQSLAKSQADCERYYEASPNPTPCYFFVYAGATGVQTMGSIRFRQQKRAAPTATIISISGGFTTPAIGGVQADAMAVTANAAAVGAGFLNCSWTASAEL